MAFVQARIRTMDDAFVEAARCEHVSCRACFAIYRDETPTMKVCERCGASSWIRMPTPDTMPEDRRDVIVSQIARLLRKVVMLREAYGARRTRMKVH